MPKRYVFYDCPTCRLQFLHKEEFDEHIGPCAERLKAIEAEFDRVNDRVKEESHNRYIQNKEKIDEEIHFQGKLFDMWLKGEISDHEYRTHKKEPIEIIEEVTAG